MRFLRSDVLRFPPQATRGLLPMRGMAGLERSYRVFGEWDGMDAESRSKVLGQARLFWVLIYAALGIWTLICLFPFYWVGATSLKGPLDIVSGPLYLPLVDYSPSTEAWRYILFDSGDRFFHRYLNSIVVASA